MASTTPRIGTAKPWLPGRHCARELQKPSFSYSLRAASAAAACSSYWPRSPTRIWLSTAVRSAAVAPASQARPIAVASIGNGAPMSGNAK